MNEYLQSLQRCLILSGGIGLLALVGVTQGADERDAAAAKRILEGDTKVDALGRVYQQPLTPEQVQAEARAGKYRKFLAELNQQYPIFAARNEAMTEQQRQKLYKVVDKYETRLATLRQQVKQLEKARANEALRLLDSK